MSDPIERMQRLRSDVEGGPMPPASEVRRRGDQLRRRRTAAMTAGAALAVVAIVAPVAFLTGGDPSGDSPHDPVDTPSETTTSAPAEPVTLSEANLLRDEDTVFTGDVRWEAVSSGRGLARDVLDDCVDRAIADLGAAAAARRVWLVDSGIHSLTHHVTEFRTDGEARTAYDQVAQWLTECPALDSDNGYTSTSAAAEIPVEGSAQLTVATYNLDPDGTATQGGEAYYQVELNVGLVVSGNRLAWLSQRMPDSTPGAPEFEAPTPVEQMLPTAAERLVLDGETDQPSTEWSTDIPADFPIDRDLSSPEGGPVQGPTPDMDAINEVVIDGTDLFPGPAVERLVAFATGPESLDGRELHTYRSASEAAQVLQKIRDAQRQSPESGGVIWTVHDVEGPGEESLTLSRTLDFGLGTDVFQFTRVGNAILAIDLGGEWSLETSVPSGIDRITDLSSAIAPEMCIYSADSC